MTNQPKQLTAGRPGQQPPISSEKTPDHLCMLLVLATLNKRGRAKGIREIAEHVGLGINTTRRHLRRLIDDHRARQIGRGFGTKYLARDYGPHASKNPWQMTPGKKVVDVPLTGPGSGRGRIKPTLTDADRKKAAVAIEILRTRLDLCIANFHRPRFHDQNNQNDRKEKE